MSKWDALRAKIGDTACDAVKKLYAYYGTEWIKWMAELYDGKTGCFYYANSSRDYDEFLPDAESTCQAIDMLASLGLFDFAGGKHWTDALPAEMKKRCLAYIQSLQSDEDGYFYHPQWGKNVGHARIGRDYSQCLGLIEMMGGKPLYKTATERISENARSEEPEKKDTGVPAYLKSKEAFIEYLDKTVADNAHFHDVGHILSSQTASIKAAGLADVCMEYLNAYQSPETGYWDEGKQHEYNKISAIIKISGLYSGLGGRLKYMDKVIDSAIDTVMSERDPDNICFVFNSIGGLGAAIRHVAEMSDPTATDNTNIDVVLKKVYEKFPEMIDATIEKLKKFRHPDGSFSFLQGKSLVNNQGVTASRGYDEGDINGTTVAIYYIIYAMFGFMGTPIVCPFTEENYKEFVEIIERKTKEA